MRHLTHTLLYTSIAAGALAATPVWAAKLPELHQARSLAPLPFTDRVIIHPASGVQAHQLSALPTQDKLDFVRRDASGSAIMRLDHPVGGADLQRLIDDLAAQPGVAWVEPDLLMRPQVQPNDDPYYANGSLWGLQAIGMDAAWSLADGQGVTIAVLDTGVLPHSDLVQGLLPGYDFISEPFMGNDGDGRDPDASDPGDWITANEAAIYGCQQSDSSWHGTHVAGTIAATDDASGVIGVAPKAAIVPIRVLGKCGGYTSDIADGLRWAAGLPVAGVPNNPNPAKVANLSLGGGSPTCPQTYQNAIDAVRAAGMSVIVAAGNDAMDAAAATPANCNGVITVAATGPNGDRAGYSNYGSVVDLAAPGGDLRYGQAAGIVSSVDGSPQSPFNDSSYAFYQGTSMAAPHVAGVAALMLQLDPTLSPDQVEQLLRQHSGPLGQCSGCGTGLLDARAVLNAIQDGHQDDDPTDPQAPIEAGVPLAAQVTEGQLQHHTFVLAAGQTMQVQLTPHAGDIDLLVRADQPTRYEVGGFDCIAQEYGTTIEQCTLSNDLNTARTYYIGAYGYKGGSYTLLVTVDGTSDTGAEALLQHVHERLFGYRDSAATEALAQAVDRGQIEVAQAIADLFALPAYQEILGPVARIYRAAFVRRPDFGGVSHWAGVYRTSRQGGAVHDDPAFIHLAEQFIASGEFASRYGNALSDDQLIDQLYLNVLGRPADQAGRTHWLNALKSGTPRGAMLALFSESSENRSNAEAGQRVVLLYGSLLGRDPSQSEYSAGLSQTHTALAKQLLQHPEYQGPARH